jgi:hypothetical protein
MSDTPTLDSEQAQTEVADREEEETTKPSLWTSENFYAPDDETNILMDGEQIKAATLPKLIAKMTSDGASKRTKQSNLLTALGPAFLSEFLMTYRSFKMDGLTLLEALQARCSLASEEEVRVRIR